MLDKVQRAICVRLKRTPDRDRQCPVWAAIVTGDDQTFSGHVTPVEPDAILSVRRRLSASH
jgi:hypothetical protein